MGTVQMLSYCAIFSIVLYNIVCGDSDRLRCPAAGGKNGVCIERRKCAVAVYFAYYGRFWRRRGFVHFCRNHNREEQDLVCCLRVRSTDSAEDNADSKTPSWESSEERDLFWNGTKWLRGDDDQSQEYENIVATNSIYQTKCTEYTQIAANVDNAISTGAPVFRTMIVGGIETLAKEFPHMALLGFGLEDNISWRCGGTLISENFVMTAAHCLYTQDLGDVQYALLGDLDINSNTDDAQPQQFKIIQRFSHPSYTSSAQYNDIALLQLENPVTYTKYVRPACLPSNDDLTNVQLIATGWGTLQYGGSVSNTLMKVDLQYYTTEQCMETFPPQSKLDNGISGDSQICAGGVNEAKDTCQGDSGGPLQIKTSDSPKMYQIVGITSFGRACGLINVPAVYTRVSYFVPWIEQIVWGL